MSHGKDLAYFSPEKDYPSSRHCLDNIGDHNTLPKMKHPNKIETQVTSAQVHVTRDEKSSKKCSFS